MSTFVSLKQVKDILGICDTLDDARLGVILDSVMDQISRKVGNLQKSDKTEFVNKNMAMLRQGFLPFSCVNASQIKTIDATDFTGKTKGVDYIILENDTAQVKNLMSFIDTDFDSFSITYTAGFDKAPDDLVNIVATMVGLEFSKDFGKDVTEETTGPRTVKWSDPSKSQGGPDAARKQISSKLNKYIPLHLRIY